MQSGFGDVQVSRGGLQIAVAEQELDAAQIGARVQQVAGERVAQHMRAKGLLDPQLLAQLLADNSNRVRLQLLSGSLAGEEPVLGLRPRQYSRRISSSFGDSIT